MDRSKFYFMGGQGSRSACRLTYQSKVSNTELTMDNSNIKRVKIEEL